MNLQAFIQAILSVLGPLLLDWIKSWLEDKLKQAAARVTANGTSEQGAAALFDAAIASTPRFAPARRALLRRLKAVAVARADEFARADPVALTQAEVDDVRDAADAAGNE